MRTDVIAAAVDAVTASVLEALQRGDPATADALRLLLRAYAATGRDDVRDAIEPALGHALEIASGSSSTDAAGWLVLFAEAADASEDPRLREAAADLAAKVRMNWNGAQPIAISAESVDAYLRALPLCPDAPAQAPIDELERVVAVAYEPGSGIAEGLEPELRVSSALLTAFALTDRLPYAMLAEELLLHARGTLLDSTAFQFSIGCLAASALARMAALHQLPAYQTAAVIAPGADYAADAAALLERIAPEVHTHGIAAAPYGLAAGELQSVFR